MAAGTPQPRNLLTRVWQQYDNSGMVTSEHYDFKGNLLRSRRQLAADYKGIPNWADSPDLESEIFESRTTYDALNRPIQQITPHHIIEGDDPEIENPVLHNVIQPIYNEANLLDGVACGCGVRSTERLLDPKLPTNRW